MIPAPPGLEAHYELKVSDGTMRYHTCEVIAFDENGTPLVRGSKEHGWGLVSASVYGRLTGIHSGDMPFVAALPAGGWRVEYTGDDGKKWSEPVVGWVVTSDGYAEALVSDSEGLAMPVSGNVRVYPEGKSQRES